MGRLNGSYVNVTMGDVTVENVPVTHSAWTGKRIRWLSAWVMVRQQAIQDQRCRPGLMPIPLYQTIFKAVQNVSVGKGNWYA